MKVLIVSLFGVSVTGRVSKVIKHVFPDDDVTVVTSDFSHGSKRYVGPDTAPADFRTVMLHVSAYSKNVSFRRIFSHMGFARSVRRYLDSLSSLPDLVYCPMPPSASACVVGKFCKKHGIPFVVDVIDLWPDSLVAVLPFHKLLSPALYPWTRMTRKAYRAADYISGESKAYAEVAHRLNPDVPWSYTYLGSDYSAACRLIEESGVSLDKPSDEIWIGYGGSLGQSYDFDVILKGIAYIRDKGVKYRMWFIGDGEKADYIRQTARELGLDVVITGRVEYRDFLKYLSYCDIAVNSFKENTLVVHSYKFNDYVSTDCFILNNLKGETASMLDEYGVGRTFDASSFNKILLDTIKNWTSIEPGLKERLGQLRSALLDTDTIYGRLRADILNSLF